MATHPEVKMVGKLVSQSYRLDRTGKDPVSHWIPEEFGRVEVDFPYDEEMADLENAEVLSGWIKKKLKKNYAVMNVDPHPVTAFIVGGDSWFGAEIFYQNPNGTMKISARVQKPLNNLNFASAGAEAGNNKNNK